ISGKPLSPEGLPVPPGGYYDEGDPTLAGMGWHANRPGCDPCCNTGCGRWGLTPICIPLPRPPLDNLEFLHGVQGFTGPVNRGGSGSFGFHEGFNWGMPVLGFMAMQWGGLWTQ